MAVHDLYRAFSDDMAARLERGDIPWAPEASGRPLRRTGHPYGGVSVLAQWSAMRDRGYHSPVWLSRPAIEALGGRLADGARPVTAWYTGMRPVWAPSRETGDMAVRVEQSWRPYAVWNAGTVEGLADTFAHVDVLASRDDGEALRSRLASLAGEVGVAPGASDEHGNEDLCRRLVRWTGMPARLNRGADGPKESLTVEIGAAFLAADLRLAEGLQPSPGDVEDWCRLMRSDDVALFRCARDATQAVAFLHGQAPGHRVAVAAPEIRPLVGQGDHPQAGTTADNDSRAYGDAARQVPDVGRGRVEGARPAEAAREARQFVAAWESCRKTGDRDQTARLLDASRRIDLEAGGVAEAIQAAAFLHGAGAVRADDWMRAFRNEAETMLRGGRVETPDLEPQIRFTGMRM